MVRTLIRLDDVERVVPLPFLGNDDRPVAWVEVRGAGEAAIYGEPVQMRELAAVATAAADQADELLRVAQLLAEAGTGERRAA